MYRRDWRVSCVLLGLLATVTQCLENCRPSQELYGNLNLGPPEEVPFNFTSGFDAQICPATSQTCCPLAVEQSIEDAAIRNVKKMIPAYSIYLDKSNTHFFQHYDYISDVVIKAIGDYFKLSVPTNVNNIQTTLNRITKLLDAVHLRNGGLSFRTRMMNLISYTYLERMRGLYDLGLENNYNNTFTECALPIIEQNQISNDISSAIDVMEYQFRSLYYYREVLYSIYTVFFELQHNLPFKNCLSSFAELFYCHICLPETASLFPCRNVCKNVVSGCTIFLHVTGEVIVDPLRALCKINTMTNDASWNLHTALETINNKLYSIFDISEVELLNIASKISSCNEAPTLVSNPIPTDNSARTTVGRVELLSNVPTSLTNSLHYILVTNLSSIFLSFENVTQKALQSECENIPEDDGSSNFECWRRQSSSVTDVDYLGINFNALLFQNQDLQPPSPSFIDYFNTSVENMKANATQTIEFIDNDIPADIRVNVDHCSLPLSQILPPTSTVAPTKSGSIGAMPTTAPTDSISSTTVLPMTISTSSATSTPTTNTLFPTVRVDSGSVKQTGFTTMLLLLQAVTLIIIMIT